MRKAIGIVVGTVLLLAAGAAQAAPLQVYGVHYPERETVSMDFVPRPGAPEGRIRAEVGYRNAQARIQVTFDSMKPAILFGRDITCYVMWAVTADGDAENLGELVVRSQRGRASFATGKKQFALLVTAEPYYLVGEPSDLVVFFNAPAEDERHRAARFLYDGFVPAADHAMTDIRNISWDSDTPHELLQARKAFELAGRRRAEQYAPKTHAEARQALEQADELAAARRDKKTMLDLARRSVALSNEALNIAAHRATALELEQRIARRRAEMERLEERARSAETAAAEAERSRTDAERRMSELRAETERMAAETRALRDEKASLDASLRTLDREKSRLQATYRELSTEKAALSRRLESALSHVAETRDSARGFVVNLPGILFDVDEATLKPEARMTLSKLAGILLVVADQSVTIEGHTDATGSPEHNVVLSERRAQAVRALLESQGVEPQRLSAVGYGMERPVADNASPEGRRQNRRVEIVISQAGS